MDLLILSVICASDQGSFGPQNCNKGKTKSSVQSEETAHMEKLELVEDNGCIFSLKHQ